jgi:tRNA 2-thiouridine synthesizing protein E
VGLKGQIIMDAKTQDVSTQLAQLSAPVGMLSEQLRYLAKQQRERDDFFAAMQPIMEAMMETATGKLGAMEGRGYFTFGREALRVADRVVDNYDEEDVRALGDNIVRIMDTVRAFTQPQMLDIANQATEAIDNADELEPTGVFGMVRASRDEDVQRGMAVFLSVLRAVGAGVKEMQAPGETKAKRPKKKRAKAERTAAIPTAPKKAKKKRKRASAQPVVIDGVAFDANGYVADASQWTPALAEAIAAAHGVPALTERHWAAVHAARNDYLENGASPNIRRLTTISDVSTKELYQLFPKAPGMTVARVAGIPKPVGCI